MKPWESSPKLRDAINRARGAVDAEAGLTEESAAVRRFQRETGRGRMWGKTPRDNRPARWGIAWTVSEGGER